LALRMASFFANDVLKSMNTANRSREVGQTQEK
jgi:hypothetical protein